MTLFTVPQTMPFGVAMVVMIGLGVIEGVGLFVSLSLSELLDRSFALEEIDMEGPLGWLHVGKVPMLVLLILFLLGFAISGYAIQIFCHALFGSYIPTLLAVVPATLIGFSNVHGLGGLLARIIPKDETTAVSEQTLIGRAGVIVTGTARQGFAAQVKVKDQFGNAHYLMVEPDVAGEEFEEGSEVLIVKKQGAIFRGIRNPHPALI
jgi:hypothetical protein